MQLDRIIWYQKEITIQRYSFRYKNEKFQPLLLQDNDGLFLQASSFNENNLTCEFEMDFVRTLRGVPTDAAGQNLTSDLTEPMFILLAVGKLTQGYFPLNEYVDIWFSRIFFML